MRSSPIAGGSSCTRRLDSCSTPSFGMRTSMESPSTVRMVYGGVYTQDRSRTRPTIPRSAYPTALTLQTSHELAGARPRRSATKAHFHAPAISRRMSASIKWALRPLGGSCVSSHVLILQNVATTSDEHGRLFTKRAMPSTATRSTACSKTSHIPRRRCVISCYSFSSLTASRTLLPTRGDREICSRCSCPTPCTRLEAGHGWQPSDISSASCTACLTGRTEFTRSTNGRCNSAS